MMLRKQLVALLLLVGLAANGALAQCEFKCGDDKCIPSSWICDNVKDCVDGKDEENCNYLHLCNAGEFMCRSGECIPAAEKCNGVSECSDSSDEKECQREVKGSVINLPSANDFEHTLTHIDIAATPVSLPVKPVKQAHCPQRNANLYFSNNDASVLSMRITDSPQSPQLFLDGASAGTDVITSLSFEHDSGELLVVSKRVPNRVRAIDTKGNTRLFASFDNERFGRIALDPVTKNFYFAENGVGIGVCEKEMSKCVLLVEAESLDVHYKDLILNPKLGQMFWIEEDLSPILKVAGMDGKKIRVLSAMEHVHGISLDAENDSLYISEEEAVSRLNLKTLVRHTFAPVRAASGMVYYNCDLYYVLRGHEILRVYTSEGEDKEVLELLGSNFQFVIVPDDFKVNQSNPCNEMKCDEVCALSESMIFAQPEAKCVYKVGEVVDLSQAESSIFGWVIFAIILLLFLTFVALSAIFYFRLWPALCERLDALIVAKKHNSNNISVGFNTIDA